jgi:NAD(P)-dependent dehydrogenase (short-subunit alcohol dehydrogenase family)
MPPILSASVAFITGAAQGLGRAAAFRLASQGAKVCIVDMSAEAAAATAKEIGPSAIPLVADVTSEEDMKRCVAGALAAFGRIDIAVNCAGIAPPQRVLSKRGPHDLGQFMKVMNVNVVGTFNSVRLAAEAMSTNEPDEDGCRGVIINTSSIAAMDGQIGQAAYAASKGTLDAALLH